MVYVKRIESNCKGGAYADLGEKTLITGKNGSGKSALVAAVELALSGRASDITGRVDVGLPGELLALAPGRQGQLFARAILSDDSVCEWSTEGTFESAKRPTHKLSPLVEPASVFPLRDLRTAVLAKPEAVRRFFLLQVAQAIPRDDVVAAIPRELFELFQQAIRIALADGIVTKETPPAEKLLAAHRVAAEQARIHTSKARDQESAASQVGQGLGAPPSVSEIAQARNRVAEEQAIHTKAISVHATAVALVGQRAREKKMRTEKEVAERTIERAQAAIEAHEKELAALPEEDDADERRAAFLFVMRYQHKMLTEGVRAASGKLVQGDTCLVCVRAGVDGEDLKRRADEVATAIQDRATGIARRRFLLDEIGSLKADVQLARADIERYKEHFGNGSTPTEEASIDDLQKMVTDARTRLAAAEDELRRLTAAQAAWDGANKVQSIAKTARLDAEQWSKLVDACKSAVGRLLGGAVGGFVARVQAYLPREDHFALVLTEGDRDVCRFGFVRDDVLHTALSGVEWARITAALAAACTPNDDKLHLIVPEDRAFDPATLGEVMRAFGRVDSQVIIATTARPVEDVEGWTVIDTDEGTHRIGDAAPPPVRRAAKGKRKEAVRPIGAVMSAGPMSDEDIIK